MRTDNFIHPTRGLRIRSRGRLPHWEVTDATYFVTLRLADSLPYDVLTSLRHERRVLMQQAQNAAERAEVCRAFGQRLDQCLDVGYGSGLLREHGQVVVDALEHFDGLRYELRAWCVMPNHVHALVFVCGLANLAQIVQGWKSYSAHAIGLGPIWAREYYDHVVRGPGELARIERYILANPAKAGLHQWPFVGYGRRRDAAGSAGGDAGGT